MRLDKFLAEKYKSRTKAAEAIVGGLVKINGKVVAPSYDFKEGDKLEIIQAKERFVSNGGYKLSKALKDFGFSVEGKTFIDVGASNGGVTDCLFQNGAKKVYCIDVGESQLDDSLKDKNVIVMDNFNARDLTKDAFPEKIDGAVIDVSFISLTYVLKNVADIIEDNDFIIALIKPQFECESKKVGKNGIVKEASVHKKILIKILEYARDIGLSAKNLTNAPIKQGKNLEYLALFQKKQSDEINMNELIKYVKL